jgi:hypothetical protein
MPELPFVPADFSPPPPPSGDGFALVPLGVEHNEGDLAAWSSSVDHIHATPGFSGHPWPDEPMTLERNEGDLRQHELDFAQGQGFTYSVLNPSDGAVIGCVYIYPSVKGGVEADVRSWVRATDANLDTRLYVRVTEWLRTDWPFSSFVYAPRETSNAPQTSVGGAEPPATS